MDTALRDFAPYVLPLLCGGLGASLGLTWAARGARAQTRLTGLSMGRLALACLVLVAVGVVGGYRIVTDLLAGEGAGLDAVGPGRMFLLGLSVGLPLGVPGLAAAWSEARRKDRVAKKRRDHVPTKDDRRRFAAQLVQQITEVSPRPRDVSAMISGDGGTVLRFEGDIEAAEGDRLTAALREDLRDVGFKRVEGQHGSREWWSRV